MLNQVENRLKIKNLQVGGRWGKEIEFQCEKTAVPCVKMNYMMEQFVCFLMNNSYKQPRNLSKRNRDGSRG